jgi:hypothetical protein
LSVIRERNLTFLFYPTILPASVNYPLIVIKYANNLAMLKVKSPVDVDWAMTVRELRFHLQNIG